MGLGWVKVLKFWVEVRLNYCGYSWVRLIKLGLTTNRIRCLVITLDLLQLVITVM
jgi:hypothetical protein